MRISDCEFRISTIIAHEGHEKHRYISNSMSSGFGCLADRCKDFDKLAYFIEQPMALVLVSNISLVKKF